MIAIYTVCMEIANALAHISYGSHIVFDPSVWYVVVFMVKQKLIENTRFISNILILP